MSQNNATKIIFRVDNRVIPITLDEELPFRYDLFSVKFLGSPNPDLYTIGFDELYIWDRSLITLESNALYSSGLGYFYNFSSLPTTSYRQVSGVTLTSVGWDYVAPPTVFIDPPTGGGETASGYVILEPDFSRVYADSYPAFSVGDTNNVVTTMSANGSSFVRGNNDFLRIGNTLKFDDWTVFLNISPTGTRPPGLSQVLLSTMESINQKSGLIFGINDANRLFVEFIDTRDPVVGKRKVIVQPHELSENNIVSLSVDSVHGTITIGNHTVAKDSSFIAVHSASGYAPSNTLYLGGLVNSTDDARYTGFFGLMKDALVLSGAANAVQLNALAPVFVLTGYQPATKQEIHKYYPIVTGAYTSEIVIETGITGYELDTLSIDDKDGGAIAAYGLSPLYGDISGSGVVYLSGSTSGLALDYSGVNEQLFFDDTYVKNYADSNLVMLKYQIDANDLIEVYSYDVKWANKISIKPQIFNVTDFYLSEYFDSNSVNVYNNGLLQIEGIDYELISGKLVSNSLAEYKSAYSYLLYDEIDGETATLTWTGWAGQYTLGDVTQTGTKDVYLNGQKLISGVDFTMEDGTNVVLTGTQLGESVEWASGIWAFPPARTGSRDVYTGTNIGYWHNFAGSIGNLMDEMVFVNGQRLTRGIDYVTVADNSLLNSDNRPGDWSLFWLYSGDMFGTGVLAKEPDITNSISNPSVSPDPPPPIM